MIPKNKSIDNNYNSLNNKLNTNLQNLTGQSIDNVDLNTLLTAGMYYAHPGCANSPSASGGYYRILVNATPYSTDGMQIATEMASNPRTFIRSYVNRSWRSWVEVTYVEGEWSPTLNTVSGQAPTTEYINRHGFYRRYGTLVYIDFYIRGKITALNGTSNNYAKIITLPFESNGYFGQNSLTIGALYGCVNSDTKSALVIREKEIRVQETYGASASSWVVTSTSYFEIGGSGWYRTFA